MLQPAYLTLHTQPTASVRLFRQTSVDRRLTPVFERDLGRTPLNKLELSPGAWLLECTVNGRPAVRYPIVLRRGEHWDGVAPDDTEPSSIPIPRKTDLPPSDVYIPAGWMWSGGDESAQSSGPRKRVWIDGFIIRKNPVTHREFIAFLDDLVAQGKQDLASRFVPSWHSRQGGKAPRLYEVNERGQHQPCPDPDGDLCELDWPVYLVTRDAAEAYAQWESSRTNEPWRLPWELEWEKAARGVDGRRFPWGDHPDPSFANVRGSRPTRALPTAIGAQEHDESIYGVRGLAGNVQDWCLDRWEPSGAPVQNGRQVRRPSTGEELCTVKGGAWSFVIDAGRCAFRIHRTPVQRRESIGFRLVRSLPD